MRPCRHPVSAWTALLAACAALWLCSTASWAEPVALTERPAAAADTGAFSDSPEAVDSGNAAATVEARGSVAPEDWAEPADLEDPAEPTSEAGTPPRAAAPADPAAPVREVVSDMVQHHAEQDRRAQLAQAYLHRPPTWIQDAATVNLGDFPTLHDPSADTERSVQTLEWVLREQARQAANRRANASAAGDAPPATGWRRLLPGHWLPLLKQNRDLVLSAGAGLLVLGWALSAWPRRPRGGARRKSLRRSAAAPQDAQPRRRRRRRLHVHDGAGHPQGHHGERSHHRHRDLARSTGQP